MNATYMRHCRAQERAFIWRYIRPNRTRPHGDIEELVLLRKKYLKTNSPSRQISRVARHILPVFPISVLLLVI